MNYLIIYVLVILCDIFSHIDFESDLNNLLGISTYLMRTS